MNVTKGPGDFDAPAETGEFDVDESVWEDAISRVAADLVKSDVVDGIVQTLVDSRGLFDWIAQNVNVPYHLVDVFRNIDDAARNAHNDACAQYDRYIQANSTEPGDY